MLKILWNNKDDGPHTCTRASIYAFHFSVNGRMNVIIITITLLDSLLLWVVVVVYFLLSKKEHSRIIQGFLFQTHKKYLKFYMNIESNLHSTMHIYSSKVELHNIKNIFLLSFLCLFNVHSTLTFCSVNSCIKPLCGLVNEATFILEVHWYSHFFSFFFLLLCSHSDGCF